MNKKLILLLLILMDLHLVSAKTIRIYHDGSGDYSTIQKGADQLSAGDTLLVYPGLYHERVRITRSGEQGAPIVIMSQMDTAAVLDGTGFIMSEWGNGMITVSFAKHVVIRGFKVQNSVANGISFNNCEHIRVSHCKSYNTQSSGIGVWYSKHVLVDSNEVVLACNDGAQECITVAGCDSFEIAYNHVHHGGPGSRGGEGIDAKHGTYGWVHHNHVHDLERLGIYVDAWNVDMHHIWVYSNVVHHCNANGIVVANENGGLVRDVYVFNNLSYLNLHYGFALAGYGTEGVSHAGRNIHFYHNTSYKNATSGWGGGLNISSPESDSIYVVDNILSENQKLQFSIGSGHTPDAVFVDNNLMYGTNSSGSYGTNAIIADPKFSNASARDFSLLKGSPAIDAASDRYHLQTDFYGNERRGRGADVGAVEAPLLIVSACESYTSPGGKLLTETGMYSDTIDDGAGNDSILLINLHVYVPTFASLTAALCDNYISPSGKYWNEAGFYMDTIVNAGGCDSILSIELVAAQASYSSITAEACGSYVSPGGRTYTTSGSYTERLENMAGCDSMLTIELTVNKSTKSNIRQLFCGSYVSASGKVWMDGGYYLDTIPNAKGCDSVLYYELDVISLDTSVFLEGNTLRSDLIGVEYQWLNCSSNYAVVEDSVQQSFTATEGGSFALELSFDACVDTSFCYTIKASAADPMRAFSEIQLYPNPSDGKVWLEGAVQGSTLKIRNSLGTVIREMTMTEIESFEVDLSADAPGIYFIEVERAEGDPLTFKLIRV